MGELIENVSVSHKMPVPQGVICNAVARYHSMLKKFTGCIIDIFGAVFMSDALLVAAILSSIKL